MKVRRDESTLKERRSHKVNNELLMCLQQSLIEYTPNN